MAQGNGGIIGPVNTVNAAECVAAKVTTFTASGTFTAGATADVDYLVVAGGGGGGGSLGGGGGAGGYRASGCFTPSPTRGSAVPVVANTPYTITIGGGGAGIGAPCATQGGGTDPEKDIPRYIALANRGLLDYESLHTNTFTLDEVNDAFDLLRSGDAGRIMINIGEE